MMMYKGKQAFLRSYGPIMAVADTVAGLPAGVPVNRVWTEVYSGADNHALCGGVWRVDALRYIVTLRPWAPDWAPDWAEKPWHAPIFEMGPEIPVWSYPGIAADGPGDMPT